MKTETRFQLICPNCGGGTWKRRKIEDDDGAFQCTKCGELFFPEEMEAAADDASLTLAGVISSSFKDGDLVSAEAMSAYLNCSKSERAAVDTVFTALTGHGFKPLVERYMLLMLGKSTVVMHKDYGQGTVSKIEDGNIYVVFEKGLRIFPYPEAFIKKYLIPASEQKIAGK